jgi:hypothetical protein
VLRGHAKWAQIVMSVHAAVTWRRSAGAPLLVLCHINTVVLTMPQQVRWEIVYRVVDAVGGCCIAGTRSDGS